MEQARLEKPGHGENKVPTEIYRLGEAGVE